MDELIRLIDGPPNGGTLGSAVIDGTSGILYRRRGSVWDNGRQLGTGVATKPLGLIKFSDFIDGPKVLIPDVAGRIIEKVFYSVDGFTDMAIGPFVALMFYTPTTALSQKGLGIFDNTGSLYDTDPGNTAYNSVMPTIENGVGSFRQYNYARDGGPLSVGLFDSFGYVRRLVWQAGTAFKVGASVVDTNNHLQQATVGGISGESEPSWDNGGGTTNDGDTLVWQDLGDLSAVTGTLRVWAEYKDVPGFKVPKPASLMFIEQPRSTGANQIFEVKVQVLDQDGNPFTYWPCQIEVAILGAGTLSGTTFQNVDTTTGIATFNDLSIAEIANGYILQAQLTYSDVQTINSDPFSIVTPHIVTTLEFVQQPTDSHDSVPIAPPVTVRVLDENGDPMIDYALPVTMTPSSSTLSGNTTVYTNPATAVATFTDLSIVDPGTGYSLHAAVGLVTANSATFDITIVPPAIWLKADSLSLTDGAPVSLWPDSSGNGNDATASGVQRPIFKTNIQNGLPIVRFNGVSSLLNLALKPNQPFTVYVVGKQIADKSSYALFLEGLGSNRAFVHFEDDTGFFSMYAGTSQLTDSVDHSGAFHVISAVFNGPSSKGYVDASLAVNGNAGSNGGGAATIGQVSIFSDTFFMAGDIGELRIYPAAHTNIEITAVQVELRTKWATP